MAYRLALVCEDEISGVLDFETSAFRKCYADGFSAGGHQYGAGTCMGVELPEELDMVRAEWAGGIILALERAAHERDVKVCRYSKT